MYANRFRVFLFWKKKARASHEFTNEFSNPIPIQTERWRDLRKSQGFYQIKYSISHYLMTLIPGMDPNIIIR